VVFSPSDRISRSVLAFRNQARSEQEARARPEPASHVRFQKPPSPLTSARFGCLLAPTLRVRSRPVSHRARRGRSAEGPSRPARRCALPAWSTLLALLAISLQAILPLVQAGHVCPDLGSSSLALCSGSADQAPGTTADDSLPGTTVRGHDSALPTDHRPPAPCHDESTCPVCQAVHAAHSAALVTASASIALMESAPDRVCAAPCAAPALAPILCATSPRGPPAPALA
jgi:hypothetical protein